MALSLALVIAEIDSIPNITALIGWRTGHKDQYELSGFAKLTRRDQFEEAKKQCKAQVHDFFHKEAKTKREKADDDAIRAGLDIPSAKCVLSLAH